MAFLKKKKRLSFPILAGILFLIIAGFVSAGAYYFHIAKIDSVKKSYDEQIQELKYDIYSLERQVYIPKEDIPCGTVMSEDLFTKAEMKLDIPQNGFIDDTDFGKVNVIALQAGMPVLKFMTADPEIKDDIRDLEFNMLMIQTKQEAGDYVDVRITFPNGEDFIVISKKRIKALNRQENLVSFWLDETEIHRISSAVIDAYIHPGTKIYLAAYVLPELQKEAVPYYPVNLDVLELMRNDPNILKKAGDVLAAEARRQLESNLEQMTNENISKVTSGVNTEISKNSEIRKEVKKEEKTETQQ
ncbi:MAG TPA: SAF domain-containing protein [Clostridia bacterium]